MILMYHQVWDRCLGQLAMLLKLLATTEFPVHRFFWTCEIQLALNKIDEPKDSFRSPYLLVHLQCLDSQTSFQKTTTAGNSQGHIYSLNPSSVRKKTPKGITIIPLKCQHRKLSQCSLAKTRPTAFDWESNWHTGLLHLVARFGFASQKA